MIGLWPSKADFATDLGEKRETVNGWERRNSLPGNVFSLIALSAERRGIKGVTLKELCDEAAKRRRRERKRVKRHRTDAGDARAA